MTLTGVCYSFYRRRSRRPQTTIPEMKMTSTKKWLIAGALSTAALWAQAEVNQVRVWAAACANCHGTDGRALQGMEALAGKDKDEMLQKLLDFKSGRKPATIMHQLSKGYSDEQLAQIVAYFAAQKKN